MTSYKPAVLLAFAIFVFSLLQGCAKKDSSEKATGVEKPIPASAVPVAKPQTTETVKAPPATMKDVEEKIHRIFGDNVTIDDAFKPNYIVGDFNGDKVEDLAVVVRAAPGKLSDINNDLANWIIQDADKFFLPGPGSRIVTMPPIENPKVEEGETLLAVIHGYGPTGWRNPDARQTYLVKHAAANFVGTTRSFREQYIRSMKLVIETDVIEENRNHRRGFIFWTGSNYAWHQTIG